MSNTIRYQKLDRLQREPELKGEYIMKQVVNGKTYNTETAEMICEYYYSNPGDFHYVDEALYVTKKGNYFIAGEGGAMSKYAKSLGNNSIGGSSGIEALSKIEALEYAQENGADVEDIEKYFADMIQEA